MQHKPGDGGRFIVRQPPFKFTVEVADRHPTVNDAGAARLTTHAGNLHIQFVSDIADDFLQDVFQRHHALQHAIFVHHQGEMLAPFAKRLQLIEQCRRVGYKPWLGRQGGDVNLTRIAVRPRLPRQRLGVNDANDIVRVVLPNRQTGVGAGQHFVEHPGRWLSGVHRRQIAAVGHDFRHRYVM